jgi:phosphoenolpyruvate-protein phosphotransferase/dihydroxyacetone kinase phosphotransfer subunit
MIALVLVAHSAALAEGAKALAEQVAGGRVRISAAGGVADAEDPIGTDATRVAEAISSVHNPDGVLVLVDLGSALLSAETALELVSADVRRNVRISSAALVEGAVAAAVAAAAGSPLDEVEGEARRALLPKERHLSVVATTEPAALTSPPDSGTMLEEVVVPNALGIHARPAGLIVAAAARYDAQVSLSNQSRTRPHAIARSLTQVAMLDGRQGDRIAVHASGPQAVAAGKAVADLIRAGFGESSARRPISPAVSQTAAAGRLSGLPASPGIVIGPARALSSLTPPLAGQPPESADRELNRLEQALLRAREETRTLRINTAAAADQEAGVFAAQLQLLDDPELVTTARARLAAGGVTAEQAWQEASGAAARRFHSLESPLLAARASDVQDVARRVLLALSGRTLGSPPLREPAVLIAPEILPSDVAQLDPAAALGLATAYGAPHSHACILARALGIPAVVGLGLAVLRIVDGQVIGLDGARGLVFPELPTDLRLELEAQATAWRAAQAEMQAACREPAKTIDGRQIEIAANIGRLDEIPLAIRLGAEGVGVLRTEFLFLGRATPPSEAEQEEAYRSVLSAMAGRRVIVRTLDIGGDKPVPFLPALSEANPYLGERGLRRSLRHPDVFLAQARALYRASAAGPLHILLPMVTTRDEIRRARRHLDQARSEVGLRADAVVPPLGIMIETPASALGITHLLPEVDFVSIGTNDLTQYTLAAERGNAQVAELYDACHPAVLRQIAMVVDAAHRAGKWAGVCGEVAADLQAIPILVGLGVDELSMAAGAIPAAKQRIRQLRLPDAERMAENALQSESAAEVRALTS